MLVGIGMTTGAYQYRTSSTKVIPEVEAQSTRREGHVSPSHVLIPAVNVDRVEFSPNHHFEVSSLLWWPLHREKGWTTYQFLETDNFTLVSGERLTADALVVGGGGAGGAGLQGGGGGAGAVCDRHNIVIIAGWNDGLVTVGEGGTGPANDTMTPALCAGGLSYFAGILALGGGYGSTESEIGGYHTWEPGNGASGGGGYPWSIEPVAPADHWTGLGGYNLRTPYTDYTDWPFDADADVVTMPLGAAGQYWNTEREQWCWVLARIVGNDGGSAVGHTAWYNITAGGGGGAHQKYRQDVYGNVLVDPGTLEPLQFFQYDQYGNMQSANPQHGGHGVPCDILGWWMYEESNHLYQYTDWYGGGGAGGERKTWWGYASGYPGYGGGGEAGGVSGENGTGGFDGTDHTGGGGGGAQSQCNGHGGGGGKGVVIVRIRRCDEWKVAAPLITGTPDPNDLEFGLPKVSSSSAYCVIRHLPEYMTHDDQAGDEQCPRTYEETH